MGRFTYDIQTYCAFFDKSTNFGTEVDQYIMSKFGGGAIAELYCIVYGSVMVDAMVIVHGICCLLYTSPSPRD